MIFKKLLQSHIHSCWAGYNYRKRLKAAISLTKVFRLGSIHMYDIGKAGTDTYCRAESDWTMRYLLLAAITSFKLLLR